MECRSAQINTGSFAANAGLRDRQLQLFLAEKLLECWSAVRMQVITGRGDAFPEQGVGARKDRDEPSCPRL